MFFEFGNPEKRTERETDNTILSKTKKKRYTGAHEKHCDQGTADLGHKSADALPRTCLYRLYK